jgi:hypothetical protein
MPGVRKLADLRREGLLGAADPWIVYAAPAVLTWPAMTEPAPRDLRDSAADLVLSTNGLTR